MRYGCQMRDEKEEAKKWVERHSCKAWRNGWCFVDGTLIPLYTQPLLCWYSLNIQIVNLPNLQIIDFGYSHTGSTHNATAWEGTRIATNHEDLLEEGEWIWADSAYPSWVISPYKKPDCFDKNNSIFNECVSNLCICSEHAIGFLKAIGVHSFAMQCKAEERYEEDEEWDF
ncbi:hypothetical protein BT96DRAFT_958144 [Gymnopus androsaceus JB14]|uniref:DDE Tnp4 domain-containing protein n=1 Tax=Gymnopus androsaceus JB14 TaxID=1447944 RepID=A0A6A4HHR6_9AGAR|nr:hypothetical protein BT96DRAFT_958144 [Gymnopus androsaceus JB14]